MLRCRTFVLAAAVGLLAVTGAGAGAESANRLPYDFVLASYTVARGDSVFTNAWRAGDGGRTYGVIIITPPRKNRVCIDVEGNEAYIEFEFLTSGQYLVANLFLRDNRASGKPDEFNGLTVPKQGRVTRVCPEFDGFGKGLNGIPLTSGDINIHDG